MLEGHTCDDHHPQNLDISRLFGGYSCQRDNRNHDNGKDVSTGNKVDELGGRKNHINETTFDGADYKINSGCDNYYRKLSDNCQIDHRHRFRSSHFFVSKQGGLFSNEPCCDHHLDKHKSNC